MGAGGVLRACPKLASGFRGLRVPRGGFPVRLAAVWGGHGGRYAAWPAGGS